MTSAVDVELLDATVFVDCLASDVDLVELVAEILDGDTGRNAAQAPHTGAVVSANEDADPDRATEWPGGFLFFPSVLEVYAAPYTRRHERADVIAQLLSSLWSRGIAAVAACEYEDLLPSAAGTGDRSLPWPAR